MICSNCRIPPSSCRSFAATRIWLHRTPYNPSLSPTRCLESISCICTKVDAHLNYDPLFINARLRLFLSDAHPYSTPTTKLAFIPYLVLLFFLPTITVTVTVSVWPSRVFSCASISRGLLSQSHSAFDSWPLPTPPSYQELLRPNIL
jgi:hypothetical protein